MIASKFERETVLNRSAQVPFLKLSGFSRKLDRDLRVALKREVARDDFILGLAVEEFENDWARFCGADHAIGVGSGLSALELSLKALGIGRGDEVLVPSNTFIATWMAVSNVGATPVPVSTSRADYNIVPELMEDRIGPKTRAVVPVHLYGYPSDLKPIREIAATHNLRVIEDAAQAHGAEYCGSRIGAHSDAVAWSFYPGKNLGAFGDGGAVTTDSPAIANKIRLLQNYGSLEKYRHDFIGTNSRLDSLQSAVLSVKLKYLVEFNSRRKAVASQYFRKLSPLAEAVKSFILPPNDTQDRVSSWHLFVVRVEDRDRVQRFLSTRGIESAIHYPIPPGNQEAYAPEYSSSVEQASVQDASSLLSLPIGPHLSETQVDQVCGALREAITGGKGVR